MSLEHVAALSRSDAATTSFWPILKGSTAVAPSVKPLQLAEIGLDHVQAIIEPQDTSSVDFVRYWACVTAAALKTAATIKAAFLYQRAADMPSDLEANERSVGDNAWLYNESRKADVSAVGVKLEPVLWAPESIPAIMCLTKTLLLVIFRLDQIISDREALYTAVSEANFFDKLQAIAHPSRRLWAFVKNAYNCSPAELDRASAAVSFCRALELSLREHDRLVENLILAHHIYTRERFGLIPINSLIKEQLPVAQLFNVRSLLSYFVDKDNEETLTVAEPAVPLPCIGGLTSYAGSSKNDVVIRTATIDKYTDAVGSLDLSLAAKRMPLPSRNAHCNRPSSCLSWSPTLH